MMIFGIGGTNGSGKDTVARMLRDELGFYFGGASEVLAEELERRGQPTDRVHKSALSAEWRREFGMAVIVDKAYESFKNGTYKGFIVGSLRHPSEVDRIHELGGKMIWIDADPKVRYERVTSVDRGRIEDKMSFEAFLADEERERFPEGDAATLGWQAVKDKSDIFIFNNGNDKEAFKKEALATLGLVSF